MMIHQALSQAHQHITMATAASLPNPPTHEVTARHSLAAGPLAPRNHQLPPQVPRNKPVRSTTFHTVRTPSLDTIEPKKKKKVPDRGLSFLDKKDDPAQEKKVSHSLMGTRMRLVLLLLLLCTCTCTCSTLFFLFEYATCIIIVVSFTEFVGVYQ